MAKDLKHLETGEIGEIIDGRYKITGLLGSGGMGSVYRGEHVTIKQPVAIKLLHPDVGKLKEFAQRFEREAFATAQVEHENCVHISDFGSLEDGRLYLVMEYLEGEALSEVLDRETRLPVERSIHIIAHILSVLEAAHSQGIVHRDVKPENIFLVEKDGDPDFAKLLDFGLAKLVGEAQAGHENLTRAGFAIGTPTYMAPEWMTDKDIDGRADLYSLSVTLYEMIAGVPPFRSERKEEVLKMHVSKPPPRIREVAPGIDVPRELEDVIRRGLSKDPKKRMASAQEYLDALVAIAEGRRPPEVAEPRQGGKTEVFHGAAPKLDDGWGDDKAKSEGESAKKPELPKPFRVKPPKGAGTKLEPKPPSVAAAASPSGKPGSPSERADPTPGLADLAAASVPSAQPLPPPTVAAGATAAGAADESGGGPPVPNPAFSKTGDLGYRPRTPMAQLIDKIKAQPRQRLYIAAGVFVLLLIMIIAFASGDGDKTASNKGSGSDDGPSGSKIGEIVDSVSGGDSPGDELEAWKSAGLKPGGFADIDAGKLGGSCRAGAVSGINVILCKYDSEEAAQAAREKGLARIGNATGASIAADNRLLIVADPQNIDPSGKRINKIIQAFRAVH